MDNIYVLRAGDTNNPSSIHEEPGDGFDTVRIEGASPADIRLSSNGYNLRISLPDGPGGYSFVDLAASLTETGSDIGSRIERIEFDDGTVWDLTQGLKALLSDVDWSTLYGTPGNDELSAGAVPGYIYGYDGDDVITGSPNGGTFDGGAGNDTLVAAPGPGSLYGRAGDDTYVLRAGDGGEADNPLYIYEDPGEGIDTIRIEGVAPADIRLHNNGYNLRISLPDEVGVYRYVELAASVTETGSDIASRIERIVFDDGTVWDLTQGLKAQTPDIESATLQGTSGNDELTAGTSNHAYLYGYDGDDLLTGSPNGGTFDGGAGNDTLVAAPGPGSLYGRTGDDTYVLRAGDGGEANNPLYLYEEVGEGIDTIRIEGIAPADIRMHNNGYHLRISLPDGVGGYRFVEVSASYTESGSDIGSRFERIVFDDGTVWDLTQGVKAQLPAEDWASLYGTPGNDELSAGSAPGYIFGYDGDDLITGSPGGGTFDGGAGNDTFVPGPGSGYLHGRTGDDTYVLRAGDGGDASNPLTIQEEPGEGIDTVRIEGIAPAGIRLHNNGYGLRISLPDGVGGRRFIDLASSVTETGSDIGSRIERIEFDDGTVWDLTQGLKAKLPDEDWAALAGTPGNDELSAGTAPGYIYGHDGDDLITGSPRGGTFDGGAGNDTFVVAGPGGGTLIGRTGDDTYVLRAGVGGEAGSPLYILEEPGEGFDTIRIEGVSPADIRLHNNGHNLRISLPDGVGGRRFIDLASSVTETGSDVGSRFERMVFDDGTVWDLTRGLKAQMGDEEWAALYGTPGNDELSAGASPGYIYGYDGDDLITGSPRGGTFDGGAGNDTFVMAGPGSGSLQGRTGDDTYVLRAGDGGEANNPLNLYEEVGEGTDTIRIEGIAPGDIRLDGYNLRISLPDGAGGYRYVNLGANVYDAGSDVGSRFERIVFDDGTVWDLTQGLKAQLPDEEWATLYGTPGNDELTAAASNYGQIYGYDGDDVIIGSPNGGTFSGGAGNDTFITASGHGYINGGTGDDTYVLSAGAGGDTNPLVLQEEQNEGTDTIRIAGLSPDEIQLSRPNWWGGVRIGLPDGEGGFRHVDLSGNYNGDVSDIGSRFERIEFDDGTVWDLRTAGALAMSDHFYVSPGHQITYEADWGVLANDLRLSEGDLTASLVSGPANGSLTLNPDGSFSYTPNITFVGKDSFVYQVSSGSLTTSATVELEVGSSDQGLILPNLLLPAETGSALLRHTPDIEGGLVLISSERSLIADPVTGQFSNSLLLLPGVGGVQPGSTAFTVKMASSQYSANVSVSTVDAAAEIDWASMADIIKPSGLSDAAWERAFTAFQAESGSTFGSLIEALTENGQRLATFGMNGESAAAALAFEVQQALDFGSLAARSSEGSMGQGWAFLGDLRLEADDDGNMRVEGLLNATAISMLDARAVSAYTLSNSVGRGVDVSGALVGATETGQFFSRQIDGTFSGPGSLEKTASGYTLTSPDGSVISFNSAGRFLGMVDSAGRQTTATYDASGRMSGMEGPQGKALVFTYGADGKLASVTDANGRSVDLAYSGNHLVSAASALATATFAWSSAGDMTSAAAAGSAALAFSYDEQGRLAAIQGEAGSEAYTYDDTGGHTITDAAGRTMTVHLLPDGSVGRMTDAAGGTVTYLFDKQGGLTGVQGTDGTISRMTTDDSGRIISVADGNGSTIRFTYEGDSLAPASFIDGGGTARSFTYDDAGRITKATWADGTSLSFAFDDDGNLSQSTNRRGETITYEYDDRGNLTAASNTHAGAASYMYDSAGRLLKTTTPEGDTSIAYDAAGRVVDITYPNGRSLSYEYDIAGRRTALEDQDGNRTEYSYDAAGRLTSVSQGEVEVAYIYDATGSLSREENSNGAATDYGYDSAGRLTTIVNLAADGTVTSSFAYGYDTAGNRTSMSTADGNWSFGYDRAGQLTTANFASTREGVADKSISYAYDSAGNRISSTEDGVTTSYTSNNLNQYTRVGTETFAYDDDGNMVSKVTGEGTWTYAYNSENRLVSVTTPAGSVTEYEYDAFGNRSASIVDGQRTEFLVDPFGFGDVVGEYGSGGLSATYLHGIGLAARIGAEGGAFYDLDAVGSVVGLSGADGSLANSYGYTPFGTGLWREETIDNDFEFNGGWGVQQDQNGITYMRARAYDANLGRFLSEDPLWLDGDVGNLPRFAVNNPISYADPLGLMVYFAGGSATLTWGLGASGGAGYYIDLSRGEVGLYGVLKDARGVAASASLEVGLATDMESFAGESHYVDLDTPLLSGSYARAYNPQTGQYGGHSASVAIGPGMGLSGGRANTYVQPVVTISAIPIAINMAKWLALWPIHLAEFVAELMDRPVNPEPHPQGASDGDPHLATFDGFGYSFQAVGEFTLVIGEGLEIQVRQEGVNQAASVNTATAMRIGDAVVGVYANPGRLMINGEEVVIGLGETVAVGGGSVHRYDFWGTDDPGSTVYEVVNEHGDGFWVNVYGGVNHLRPFVAASRAGLVSGLLGNADANQENDFKLRDGTQLPGLPEDGVLYGAFADSWRIRQEDSLFDYNEGESTDTFQDPDFPSGSVTFETLDPGLREWVEDLVRAIGLDDGTRPGGEIDPVARRIFENTVLDVALTGDPRFANAAVVAPRPGEQPGGPVTPPVLPVVVNDVAETEFGQTVIIDVLANDSHPNGTPLIIHSVFSNNGIADIVDGKLHFTPAEGFSGRTTLSYIVSDGAGGALGGSVEVTVLEEPASPVAVNDTAETAFGQPVVIDVLANDTHPDGSPLTIQSASAAQGTVVIEDGKLLYTPAAGFSGVAALTYVVADAGGRTQTGTVAVTVGPEPASPVAVNDTAGTAFGQPVVIDVLANDTHPDGSPLTIQSASAEQGTVVVENGKLLYTPAAGFSGVAALTYVVADAGGRTQTGTVAVTVGPEPASPVAVNDTAETALGQPVVIDVLANDTHPDGSPLTIQSASAAQGTVVIENGKLLYTPAAGFSGVAELTYVVADAGGRTQTGTVAVTVAPEPGPNVIAGTPGADSILGTEGADDIDAGAGNDLVRPLGGDDLITLGEGADILAGKPAELFGDTVRDFGNDDLIVFQDARFSREQVTLDGTPAILAVDLDRDGTADGSIKLLGDFSGGDFMAVAHGPDTVVSFETLLPRLQDRQAVDDGLVNGIINEAYFRVDQETDFEVSISSGGAAAFNNTLGAYEIRPDGSIANVRILVDNANAGKGSTVTVSNVEAGNTLAFFLVQNAAQWAASLGGDDMLMFRNAAGGVANFSDPGAELVVNGVAVNQTVIHGMAAHWNTGGVQHALSGVDTGGGSITIGFEDLIESSDFDFQDVVFSVERLFQDEPEPVGALV